MVTTTNLEAYYKFDETSGTTATDAENSNDLTITGCTVNQTGKLTKAYDFDGTNDYVSGTITNLPIGSTARSVNMWVYSHDVGNYIDFFTYGTAATNQLFHFRQNNDATIWFQDQGTTVNSTGTLTVNTWHMVTMTFDGTDTVKLYIDGSEDGSSASFSSVNTGTTYGANIGRYPTGAEYWNGLIDEVSVWSRALSASDISDLYNSGSGLAHPFVTDITVTPSALSLSTSETVPTITVNIPENALVMVSGVLATGEAEVPSVLGTMGTRYIARRWPVTSGLTATSTKQEGRVMNLVAENSNVKRRLRKGL